MMYYYASALKEWFVLLGMLRSSSKEDKESESNCTIVSGNLWHMPDN
jgi:hypothetical protein